MDAVAPPFPWRATLRGSLGAGVVLLATALILPPALATLTPLELLADQATLRLSYADLQRLPAVEAYVTLECISNEVGGDLISNALWKGVALREILARAGVKPQAQDVVSYAADGYSESLPLAAASGEPLLLAYAMNGEPLAPAHGFPRRLLFPGRYGMKSTKWLTRLELVAEDYRGYWEQRGWDKDAIVKTMSRLDRPRPGARLPFAPDPPHEPLTLGGIAFAGRRGIRRVEVSTDGGRTWQEASLGRALSPNTWVLWTRLWEPAQAGATAPAVAGPHVLQVRAVDGAGALQTAAVEEPFPSGATGYHTVRALLE